MSPEPSHRTMPLGRSFEFTATSAGPVVAEADEPPHATSITIAIAATTVRMPYRLPRASAGSAGIAKIPALPIWCGNMQAASTMPLDLQAAANEYIGWLQLE